MARLLIVAGVIVLSSCVSYESVTTPLQSQFVDVHGVDPLLLCKDYNQSRNKDSIAELLSRALLNELDAEAIARLEPVIGMNSLAAVCIYGTPTSINNTVVAEHTHTQWVYCRNDMLSAKLRANREALAAFTTTDCGGQAFLYFDNSKLVAHQNVQKPVY